MSPRSELGGRGRADVFVFFNHTATTEIYPLSLHDALPISNGMVGECGSSRRPARDRHSISLCLRSEEHTSELQPLRHLVCRLLLGNKDVLPGYFRHQSHAQGSWRHYRGRLCMIITHIHLYSLLTLFFFTDPPPAAFHALPLHDPLPS